MKQAIIFDMDGVLIDSESVWARYEKDFAIRLLGRDIYEKLQSIAYGGSIQTIYEEAKRLGFTMKEDDYRKHYNKQAAVIYKEARITNGIDEVMTYLSTSSYRVGLVTASPKYWVTMVMKKFLWRDAFNCVVSIDEERLAPKPDPAGYQYALQILNVRPEAAIVIEDSNTGIAAAKAAGMYTIGLRQHVPATYISRGADRYINHIREILPVLQKGIR